MAFYTEAVTIGHRTTFQRFWTGFMNWCEIVGYSRAAAQLTALGHYEEAKRCMDEVAKLKK